MIDINVPIHKVLEFGEQNILYTVIGVSCFLFTTIGSMMIKCSRQNKKEKAKLKKHQDEIKQVTEKVLQDAVKSHNIVIMQDVPLKEEDKTSEPFEVVDKVPVIKKVSK